MASVKGYIVPGCGHFGQRMTKYRDVFTEAAGEKLYPGSSFLVRICYSPRINRI
jgi:hypothetical protein